MNLTAEDVATGAIRDRNRIGASLADIDPMSIDRSVSDRMFFFCEKTEAQGGIDSSLQVCSVHSMLLVFVDGYR